MKSKSHENQKDNYKILSKQLYFLLAFLTSAIGSAQIVNIPDAVFKTRLLDPLMGINTNADNQIQVSEALATTELSFYAGEITSMVGIEAFTNLTSLQINEATVLTSLNLSSLTNLHELSIHYGHVLTSLDISNLANLESLSLSGIVLTSLNLTGLSNLNSVSLDDINPLVSINFTGVNPETLTCKYLMNLPSINLSGMSNLKTLSLTDNYQMQSLNISGLVNVESFTFSGNTVITSLDLTGFTNLKTFLCRDSHLASINCNGLAQLESLDCAVNGLMNTLQVTGCNSLKFLNCERCYNISTLDLTGKSQLESLYCSNDAITALNLSDLVNLKRLSCNANQLTSLNLSPVAQLIELGCAENQLQSLDVGMLTDLKVLNCGYNQLTVLDVSALDLTSLGFSYNQIAGIDLSMQNNLESLDISNNPMNVIDVSNMPLIKFLACVGNHLTALNISHLTQLEMLSCSNNELTNLNLPITTLPINLSCQNNLFTSLDISAAKVSYFDVSANPNLTYVNMKNGYSNTLDAYSCPNLSYVCVDDFELPSLPFQLIFTDQTGIAINSYCSFSPGGNYNTISGTVAYHSGGCGNAASMNLSGIRVNVNDGIDSGATFTDANGHYVFFTQAGDFTVAPEMTNPLFEINPSDADVSFADNANHTETRDFCITAVGNVQAVEVSIIPAGAARPGFDTSYHIIYRNKGNQVISGNVTFAYNHAVLDFIQANPAVDSQSPGSLSWDYANLQPFETRVINITLNLNSPMETPAVNIGDILHFNAVLYPIVSSEGDSNNYASVDQVVNGSFDPNDKTCLEGTSMTPEQVGKYLNYVIRFQNSGTAPAEFVVVKDVIDTTKFDISTLQLTGSSHPHTTKITVNTVEFNFQNINLPAEQDDEPASHGFVAFKVKTKSNLVLGNSVSNTADIYFDYNWPITTNTALTTVALLAKDHFEDKTVSVYPNPTRDKVTITAKDNITSIQLFDLQGRLVQTTTENKASVNFNLGGNASGVYFVKVRTEKGIKVEKIIKK